MGLSLIDRPFAGDQPDASRGLSIERLGHEEVREWMDVTVSGWMELDGSGSGPEESYSREALEAMMADFMRPESIQRYLARVDRTPVASASIRLNDGLAQLCGATTLPAFRRRGIQTALLAARLRDARAAGCDLAVVTTAPGSKSQANARRQGFQQLYARAVLVRTWE
jgi:GNAT superfamily N-acetyltransferase